MTEQYCTWGDCVATLGKQSPHYNSLAPLAFDEFQSTHKILKSNSNYCESFFRDFLKKWIPKIMKAEDMSISNGFVEVVGTMIKFPEVEITPIVFPY